MKLLIAFSVFFSFTNSFATEFNGYIVKLKENSQSLLSKKFTKTFSTENGTFARFLPAKNNFTNELEQLKKDPNVEYVEPNWIIKVKMIPGDSSLKKQWGLINDGSSWGSKKGEDLDVAKAWDITKGSKGLKIAVIDTGVDYTHPDLKNQIDVNLIELNGKAGVDDDGNGYIDDIYGYNFSSKSADPMDGHGHGTHCAGVIGAEHNSTGIAGVMGDVKIIPVKFLSDSGSGEEIDAIAAIDYAIKRGAKILSNSWGGSEKSQALEDAVKMAEEKGIVFVAAAGNDYANNDSTDSYPANINLSNVISVGAFSNKGSKASFSNYGAQSVHVFAPGEDIYSTLNKASYQSMSGTSMATPHVSGVIGLLLSKEPNLTPAEVKERLIRTSTTNGKLAGISQSNGRVDALRVLINQ